MPTWLAGLAFKERGVATVLAGAGVIAALTMAVAPSSQSAVRRVAGQRAGTHRPILAPPRAFRSCPSLVRYGRRNLALTHGVPETPLAPVAAPVGAPNGPGGTAAPAPAAGAPAAGGSGGGNSSYSTTNNQEPGVDEPDTVKADGSTIFEAPRVIVGESSVVTGLDFAG